MRERRIMLGLTQHQMAELIGVTYQQAHKYEKGINRVAAGRLYHIAQALGVKVGYFFEGLGRDNALKVTPQQRLLLELGRNFIAIPIRKLCARPGGAGHRALNHADSRACSATPCHYGRANLAGLWRRARWTSTNGRSP
jgi:transcriptional regulator with XRE-family HTH domain